MSRLALALILGLHLQTAQASGLKSFVKTCALGAVAGAAVGLASLALEKNPSDSWNNVAKGASLGLYAGIGYGVYQINQEPEPLPAYSVAPRFLHKGQVEGVQVVGTLFQF